MANTDSDDMASDLISGDFNSSSDGVSLTLGLRWWIPTATAWMTLEMMYFSSLDRDGDEDADSDGAPDLLNFSRHESNERTLVVSSGDFL